MEVAYTKEQLKKIKSNLSLININAIKALNVIKEEPNINHSDVGPKAELGKFVADKCIAAFIGIGLIERIDDGVKRYYRLTKDGEELLKVE